MSDHQLFMQRALDLARLGSGRVSPNPMVGCVIIRDGQIIGEGWHREYGGPHAEVNAMSSVTDPERLRGSTVYVTLEPCSHYGKTPPCADALVRAGVREVVIGCGDPNPKVNGRGVSILKEAGILVTAGILETEALELNRRFITRMTTGRPYVMLKWAETADGFLARRNGDSKWISGEASRQMVHAWRAEEDGILVGTNTALYDNPQLTVRAWLGRNPLRVVLDPDNRLPGHLDVFDGTTPTRVYTRSVSKSVGNTEWVALGDLPVGSWSGSLLADLAEHGMLSLMVEGGAATLQHFLSEGCWDEARVFTSPLRFGDGLAAPKMDPDLRISSVQVDEDLLTVYRREP